MSNISKNEKYVISILADLNHNILYIPKAVKYKSRSLTSPEASLYFENVKKDIRGKLLLIAERVEMVAPIVQIRKCFRVSMILPHLIPS